MDYEDYRQIVVSEDGEEKCEAFKAARSDHKKLTTRWKKYRKHMILSKV